MKSVDAQADLCLRGALMPLFTFSCNGSLKELVMSLSIITSIENGLIQLLDGCFPFKSQEKLILSCMYCNLE